MHDQVDHLRQDVGSLTTLVEAQGRVQKQILQQQNDLYSRFGDMWSELREFRQDFHRQFPPPDGDQ